MARRHCKGVNEEFTQCVIFDGNTKDANIIGVEYILSEPMFEGLPEDELKRWHPHNYEILSGQLTLPGVPSVAEKAALKSFQTRPGLRRASGRSSRTPRHEAAARGRQGDAASSQGEPPAEPGRRDSAKA
ncbi:DUF1264 domain-containing protein [Sorangium sp. So ce1014]|uniref:DUF1264 domain-containing protein n=1 Tax=Sorangium sp. So ce1014 TaxID=3133326 RepID=UPI003F5E01B4